jgi:hypothetical protein
MSNRDRPKASPLHQPLTETARGALLEHGPGAIAQLEAVLVAVDDTSHACPCCKLTVRRAFRDHQLADNLRSTLTMLKRWHAESRDEQRVETVDSESTT